jgi:hypothetical protein
MLEERPIKKRPASRSLTEHLNAGDHLDVAVGFGPNGDCYYDSTGVSMQIAAGSDTPPSNRTGPHPSKARYSLMSSCLRF